MNIDDIVFDSELKLLKKGEVYLFSDSYGALKHYDRNLSHIENNKLNKKMGYVYKGRLKHISKNRNYPFEFESNYELDPINPIIDSCTFACRI